MNSQSQNTSPASSNFRWVICALLFFSTTNNYMDRQVIGYLKDYVFCAPAAKGGFGWSNTDFSNLTSFFTGVYACFTLVAGWMIDKIGTKLGLALSLIFWSICGIVNAFVGSLVTAHIIIRSFFAAGEAGNFPASVKTVAEWFPKRERALATAIFNAGSNGGAMVAAFFVPWCIIHFGTSLGWKMAFILTGASGFFWLIFWFWLYNPPNKSKRLSKAEYDYIHVDDETKTEKEDEKIGKGALGEMFSFEGRIPRAAFWGTSLFVGILTVFVFLMTNLIVIDIKNVPIMPLFWYAWLVVALWITLTLQAKRWHDLGKSGWLVLINIVPIIGSLASLVVLGFFKGITGSNKFGGEGNPGLLGHRQSWSFFAGKFMTDGIWWFYLFWLPDYLFKQFHMTPKQVMLPTFIVFGVAIVGSIYGGSIPMTLIKRGFSVYQARMTTMLIIAVCPLAVLLTQYFGDVNRFDGWAATLAIAMICIGATAHQAWSANLFTTVSDMFPKKTVASMVGIGTTAGGVGGVIVQKIAGKLTDHYKATPETAYLIMFVICAFSYLIAWTIMKILVPRHKPITDL